MTKGMGGSTYGITIYRSFTRAIEQSAGMPAARLAKLLAWNYLGRSK